MPAKPFDLNLSSSDIVDIKPANMEELTEVITAAEFHPNQCNTFVYSSSKGTIRLCDMRTSALCDKHAKSKSNFIYAEGPQGKKKVHKFHFREI